MLFCIVFGTIFVVFGAAFYHGKAMFLAPGWQQMCKEEKAKINIAPLCKNIGVAIFVAGIIMLLAFAFKDFREYWLRWVMVGWLVLCGLDLLFISKTQRYTKQ